MLNFLKLPEAAADRWRPRSMISPAGLPLKAFWLIALTYLVLKRTKPKEKPEKEAERDKTEEEEILSEEKEEHTEEEALPEEKEETEGTE